MLQVYGIPIVLVNDTRKVYNRVVVKDHDINDMLM